MQKVLQLFCALIVLAVSASGQTSKVTSLKIIPTGEAFGIIFDSPTGLLADQTFSLPTTGGTLLVSPTAGVSSAWLLGGNDVSSTPTLNQIGTTSAQDLQLVAGGASNVRLTLSNTAAVVTVNNGGELRLAEASPGTDYSSFKVGTQTGNINYTLPTALPTTNQVLTATAVSGSDVTLGWAAGGGGGGAVTTVTLAADFGIADNDVTYDNITGMNIALAANTTYEVSAVFVCDQTAGNDPIGIQFTVPAGAFLYLRALTTAGNAGNSVSSVDPETRTTDGNIVFHGFIRTAGTAGNITAQAALDTSSGGTDTWNVVAGSTMSIKTW